MMIGAQSRYTRCNSTARGRRRASWLTLLTTVMLSLAMALALRALPDADAATGCAGADASATSAPAEMMRRAVSCLINQQRAQRDLPPLHESSRLDRSAQRWTEAMVRSGQFSHGLDFSARISAVGYMWSYVGENIASGFAAPREVVRSWMASTGHCQNILSPSYTDVGTGVDPHPLGRYPPATWTQDFGLWIGHRPPSHNLDPARGCPYRM